MLPCKPIAIIEYIAAASFIFIAISLAYPISNNKALAWSYQDVWWFGASESSSIGNIRIIYTYPDEIQVNKPLLVGVTLQYIKNKAVVDWVVFSNVSIYLKPTNELYSSTPIYSENAYAVLSSV